MSGGNKSSERRFLLAPAFYILNSSPDFVWQAGSFSPNGGNAFPFPTIDVLCPIHFYGGRLHNQETDQLDLVLLELEKMKKYLYITLSLLLVVILSLRFGKSIMENIERAREEKRRAETNKAQKRILSFYASFEKLINLSRNPYFSPDFRERISGLADDRRTAREIAICSNDKPDSYEVKEIEGPTRFRVTAKYKEDREEVFSVRVIKSGGEWLIDEVDCPGE